MRADASPQIAIGQPAVCEKKCKCEMNTDSTRLVVVTGGPGAGKTAVLEMAKKIFCEHVVVMPESASIVFGGGFWRIQTPTALTAAQRAIYHVQSEMENLVLNERRWSTALCDRGTLDGLAYWGDGDARFWEMTHGKIEDEYAKYSMVIHLRSPSQQQGYNHQNPLRIENAAQAHALDEKIFRLWSQHPKYVMIESTMSFLDKAHLAIQEIKKSLPDCCRSIIAPVSGLSEVG
jgi:hypothetical protein